VSAAFGSIVMGLIANYPVALAPGMGLNAYFAFVVVQSEGASWQTALGAVFVAGVAFVVLSLLPVREWLINAIPRALKLGIAAGIGLFLAFIGLRNAGSSSRQRDARRARTLTEPGPLLALGGFALDPRARPARHSGRRAHRRARHHRAFERDARLRRVARRRSRCRPIRVRLCSSSTSAARVTLGMLSTVLTFPHHRSLRQCGHARRRRAPCGMLDEQGRLPRLGRALLADSSACVMGALLGTSSVTSYIESAAGVKAGGRTGLTAVTVGVLFLLGLFFSRRSRRACRSRRRRRRCSMSGAS
jgi:AGZA family xanthine/uracil permease-like MFS transporter